MTRIDLIARTLTGIIAFGFLFAGIFDILDYFIMKFILFGLFAVLVIYMAIILNKKEIHHKV